MTPASTDDSTSRPPARRWTDLHSAMAMLAVLSAATTALDAGDNPTIVLVTLGLTAVTVVAGLIGGSLAGFGAGALSAAAFVQTKARWGVWDATQFPRTLTVLVLLLLLGAVAGMAGNSLRRRLAEIDELPTGAVVAAPGTLGLLSAELAEARLAEELHRAERTHGVVTVLMLGGRPADPAADPGLVDRAWRSVARLLESMLGWGAVPFAADGRSIGAILPETTSVQAWEVLGRVLDALGDANVPERRPDDGTQASRRLAAVDLIELRATALQVEPQTDDPTLADVAARALADARADLQAAWAAAPGART